MKRALIISAAGAVALLFGGCVTNAPSELSRAEKEDFEVRIELLESRQSYGSSTQLPWSAGAVTENGKEINILGGVRHPARVMLPIEATLADVWKAGGGAGDFWNGAILLTPPDSGSERMLGLSLRVRYSRYPKTEKELAILINSLARVAVLPGTVVFFSEEVY